MKKFLSQLNDKHWYLIGAVVLLVFIGWIYGCESKVISMVDPDKKVGRDELQAEADFLLAKIKARMSELDKKDALKMLVLEQAQIFGSQGQFNPAGLLNTAISVGAIAFGLDRNRKYKLASKTDPPKTDG